VSGLPLALAARSQTPDTTTADKPGPGLLGPTPAPLPPGADHPRVQPGRDDGAVRGTRSTPRESPFAEVVPPTLPGNGSPVGYGTRVNTREVASADPEVDHG
jgi:hypothetical protein